MARSEAEVKEIIKCYIEYLKQEIHIEKVILYGSYANESANDGSDVDLAVISPEYNEESNYLKDWAQLYTALRKSKVDPIIEPRPLHPAMPPFFREEIEKTGKVIYEEKDSNGTAK